MVQSGNTLDVLAEFRVNYIGQGYFQARRISCGLDVGHLERMDGTHGLFCLLYKPPLNSMPLPTFDAGV
jgi:hypothetical protein